MRKPAVQPRSPKEEELDRLLGPKALFKMSEVTAMGAPSVPTQQRARRQGLLKVVKNGASTDLPRAEVKRIFLEGLGPISFLYGKEGEKKSA
jgi:hypothetical protein